MQGPFVFRLMSVLAVVSLLATAQEPVKPKLNPRIMTATRQVTLFTGLEIKMLQTIQKSDKAGLEAMLTEDFALEMPNVERMEGDDWVDSVTTKDFVLKKFGVRQVSVVELGDAAVVKFDRLQDATYKGATESGEFFVVDVWKKTGDTWKLANRFVSKVSSVLPPNTDAKPTGKQ
ncbi:MAG TPA: nuclear transport factor 2 family protein [Candidatus Angelobacter sp.]